MADIWGSMLVDQLEFYMAAHLRPRLEGLTDDEYFWKPVDDCWSLTVDAEGNWEGEWFSPEPDPPPVTTIGWRLAHIAVANLGTRVSAYFGDGTVPDDVDMFDARHRPPVPGNAGDAIALLEDVYARWRDGIASLDDEQLAARLGPKGGPLAADPMASLVLHVSRETMHHGGEIGVLRDLYRAQLVLEMS
jgi:hypothetical protein